MQQPTHDDKEEEEMNAYYRARQQAFVASDFWTRTDPNSFMEPKSDDDEDDMQDEYEDAHDEAS